MTDINEINHGSSDLEFGYTSLIARIVLDAVEQLGVDAVDDEGLLNWLDVADIPVSTVETAIAHMPIKNGRPDPKPAIRRINEQLDARALIQAENDIVEVEVQFDHTPIAEIAEPTIAEVANVDEVELESWDDNWIPEWAN